MGFKKNNPGCNCCSQSCDICAAESFDLADGADLSTDTECGWTVESGTWDINDTCLRCTAAGLILCDATHPDGDPTQSVEVDFQHNTSASSAELVFNYIDANNYYYVRFIVGTNSVLIRKVSGGTHSTIATSGSVSLPTSTTIIAKVCVNEGGNITAYVNGTAVVAVVEHPAAGPYCGLSCNGSGTAKFARGVTPFSFVKAYNSTNATTCADCTYTCGACASGTATGKMQVVIANMGNLSCGSCSGLNGTYICDGPVESFSGSVCSWIYFFPSPVCTWTRLVCFVEIDPFATARYRVNVIFDDKSGSDPPSVASPDFWMPANFVLVEPAPCSSISGSVSTFAANSGGQCKTSGPMPTATVTAL